MRRLVANTNLYVLCIGIIIGMFVVGLTKPTYKIHRPVYTYLKVSDWSKQTNSRKIAYYEHLVNTKQ